MKLLELIGAALRRRRSSLRNTAWSANLRVRVKLVDSEIAERRATILELIASLEIVDIDPLVLERAAQPMPTELGTPTPFIWPRPCSGRT